MTVIEIVLRSGMSGTRYRARTPLLSGRAGGKGKPDGIKDQIPTHKGTKSDILARPKGFEPLAYRLGGDRSILLSYGRIFNFSAHIGSLYIIA